MGKHLRHRELAFDLRGDGAAYDLLFVDAGSEHIQISVSPTGRSVQVYVGDSKVWPMKAPIPEKPASPASDSQVTGGGE